MIIQRRTRRLSAAALALGVGALLLVGPLAPPAAAATPVASLDASFASLLNGLRSTLGLGQLTVDPEMSSVARAWSTTMARSGTLYHNPSLSSQVSGWQKLGENVGQGGGVTQVFNALVASPPHMKNMSDRAFTRIGVGTVTDSTGRLWTTHVFMQPKSGAAPAPAPPVPAPAPTAPPTPATARPAPTTVAAAPVPPTTAAPATVPVPATPAAPVPAHVAAVAMDEPTEAPVPLPQAVRASSSQPGPPAPLLAGAAALGLLLVGGAGLLLRRSASGGVDR